VKKTKAISNKHKTFLTVNIHAIEHFPGVSTLIKTTDTKKLFVTKRRDKVSKETSMNLLLYYDHCYLPSIRIQVHRRG
jgi:hypothetical protein